MTSPPLNDTTLSPPHKTYQQTLAFPYEWQSLDFQIEFYPSYIFTGSTLLLNKFHLLPFTPPFDISFYIPMTMEQRDRYISQSELPPYRSPSLLSVPAPSSPASSLLAQLSSPAPSDTSSSLIAVEPKYSLDKDAVAINHSFVMQMGHNHPVISAPTRLLNVPITYRPTSALTECFWCSDTGHYREDCPQYICPHCHLSAPGHSQTTCLSTQCNFCSQWEHSNRFCPIRTCNLCDRGGHIIDDCPINVLSPEQVTHTVSLEVPLTLDRNLPCGVLIEPGVRLYKGGNVMICLLASGIFLFSFHRQTHLLFGMCSYDWVHCLILLYSSNSTFVEL